MSFSILLAEPESVQNLYPFSLLHCAWEVRCGALKLYEKFEKRFPENLLYFIGRGAHLQSFISRTLPETQEYPTGNLLVVNATLILTSGIVRILESKLQSKPDIPKIFTANDIPFAYYIPSSEVPFQPRSCFFEGFEHHPQLISAKSYEVEANFVAYLWDAIEYNGMAIREDAQLFSDYEPLQSSPQAGVYVENPDGVLAAENSSISPGVVLDATDGPIILGKNVRIMAQATIVGPCAIGDNSIIKIGAKIYQNSTIGPSCKVGGEVENSILHAYSNKQHDGFLGHSYLGEWVNLGADTNTSDLKNTYGDISIQLNGNKVDTGRMFLGLLCGDHTKSGINTMFTTGTVTGIFANIFGAEYQPAAIGSFTWGTTARYEQEKAFDVARIVMQRRNCTPTDEEIELWKTVYRSIS